MRLLAVAQENAWAENSDGQCLGLRETLEGLGFRAAFVCIMDPFLGP